MTGTKPSSRYPRTVSQFVAYQLARRFRDFDNLRQYLAIAQHVPLAFLLQAYRQATDAGDTVSERRRLFWQIIERSLRR